MSFIFCAIFFLFLLYFHSFSIIIHLYMWKDCLVRSCSLLLLHPYNVEWILFFAYLSRKLWYEIMSKTFIDGKWSEDHPSSGCDIYCLHPKGIVKKYVDIDIWWLNRNRSIAWRWIYIKFKPIICQGINSHCIENFKDVVCYYLLHRNLKTIHRSLKEQSKTTAKNAFKLLDV